MFYYGVLHVLVTLCLYVLIVLSDALEVTGYIRMCLVMESGDLHFLNQSVSGLTQPLMFFPRPTPNTF